MCARCWIFLQPWPDYLASLTLASNVSWLSHAISSAESAGFGKSELSTAKTELSLIRHRDLLPVVLKGATGSDSEFVNGIYVRTREVINEKPVFVKVGDVLKCMFSSSNGRWFITTTMGKDANVCKGWARTEPHLWHPNLAKKWEVFGDATWRLQPIVASNLVCGHYHHNLSTKNKGKRTRIASRVHCKPAIESLELCIEEGDLFGLELALEATVGDEAVANVCETAKIELARMVGLLDRFGSPMRDSSALHVVEIKDCWIAVLISTDSTGRTTVCTKVFFHRAVLITTLH